MAQIQIPPDSTGKYVDTAALTDGLVTVQRQKIVLAGGSGTAEVVAVTNAAPAGTEMGLAVRQVGTATVAGHSRARPATRPGMARGTITR